MTKTVLGIIGGSGIYDLPGLERVREVRIESPWGEPSAALRIGEISGLPVVFLSRHDRGHGHRFWRKTNKAPIESGRQTRATHPLCP